jgi:uncharacterized protein (TIGR02569 family)
VSGAAPGPAVLAAFGAAGSVPVRYPGGQGRTWRAGDIVLKPVADDAATAWVADACAGLVRTQGFRVPAPVRAMTGGWAYAGWEAWERLDGEPAPGRLDDVLSTGLAFHAAVAALPRPPYIERRGDPWAYGDRVAWGELPVAGDPRTCALLAPLAAVRRPVRLPGQVVHGDLGGNVLFPAGGADPPAVIDWSVYFRPVGWALAVAAVDAVTWSGVAPAAVDSWSARVPAWEQMLVRALMYRIATREAIWRAGLPTGERDEHYAPVVAWVRDRADSGANTS